MMTGLKNNWVLGSDAPSLCLTTQLQVLFSLWTVVGGCPLLKGNSFKRETAAWSRKSPSTKGTDCCLERELHPASRSASIQCTFVCWVTAQELCCQLLRFSVKRVLTSRCFQDFIRFLCWPLFVFLYILGSHLFKGSSDRIAFYWFESFSLYLSWSRMFNLEMFTK